MKSKFKAMVLSCMDPRFQHLVHNHLKKKKLIGKYSAFTIAGAAVGVTHNKFKKWHKTFFDNLATSILKIKKTIKKKFPKLKIELYLISLDKRVKQFNKITI